MAFVVGCHLLAVSFWFAALWPLRQGVSELEPVAAAELLEAFSSRGVWAVGMLGISGIVISWVQMQGLTPFLTTDYGNRLLIKLVLVAFVIGLALMNKLRLTAKVRAAADDGVKSLRQSIKGEYVIIVLVIGLAMSLTLPSPPRALVASAGDQTSMAGGFSTEVTKDDVTATVDVTPARPGENMIMINIEDAQGNPLALQELRIFLSLPAASLDGIEKVGEAMSPGMYHFTSGEMIIPGEWVVRIDAYVDDFDKRILRTNITIQ